jgi:hypothetical protein
METQASIIRFVMAAWLILLATVIFYRLLTGSINTKGMLDDKGSGSGFSPARLQLMISTAVVALYYIGQALTSKNTGQFPTIPNEMLVILGGSHAFYLGSKTIALLLETLGLTKKH